MSHARILHLFTPSKNLSPFDVNMAVDAGFEVLPGYTNVSLEEVTALTQDAIFSRSSKGLKATGIFIGGRDAMLAADMLDKAKAAMLPPFAVSLMADPSGAYTTAAAMVACSEAALRRSRPQGLDGARVVVIGGSGPVGRIAGVLAAQAGAQVVLTSHGGKDAAQRVAEETGQRFGVTLAGASGKGSDLRAALAGVDLVLACAAAGVQVLSTDDVRAAEQLKVAADVNAVPPLGIQGVGVQDDAKPIAGLGECSVLGIGALAIGNVKYQTQNRLLKCMLEAEQPVVLSFAQALASAREQVAQR